MDVFVSFRFFSAKENLQLCGDDFFDILITSKGASALGFETLIRVQIRDGCPFAETITE